MDALKVRVDRLERDNRRLRLALLVVLGSLGSLAFAAPWQSQEPEISDEFRARRFTLVDRFHNERAVLGITPSGKATLVLKDGAGSVTAEIGAGPQLGPAKH